MTEPRHLGYLDALRGYAILAVMIYHTAYSYHGLPAPLAHLLGSGLEGVWLFFAVSAFTLMRSWTERRDGAAAFYLRRLFRIGPMWWLAIVAWTIARALVPALAPAGLTGWDLLAGATFTHGLRPSAINAVVPGAWSIGAEAIFYVLFPLLALTVTTSLRAFALAVLAALFTLVLQTDMVPWIEPFTTEAQRSTYFYFWFPRQMPVFALGIAAFYLARTFRPAPWIAEAAVAIGLVTIGVLHSLPLASPPNYGVAFGVLIFGMAHRGGRYLVNRAAVWIGQRSYSAYFWHFAVLAAISQVAMPLAMRLALALPVTLLLSHLSYRLVELPGIRLGKHLLEKRQRPVLPDAAPVAPPT